MAKSLIRITLAGVAFAVAAAFAPAAVPAAAPGATHTIQGGRPCFTASEVHNFRGGENGPIYVRVRVSEVFELTTPGCPGSNFTNSLNLRPDGPSDQICVGDSARFVASGAGTVAAVCAVRVTRKLTPEQVAALPASSQP